VQDVIDVPGRPGESHAAAGSADFRAPSQHTSIYRSQENGVTWTRLETIVPHTYVWAMAMCPNEPDRPLIATNGDGVTAARL
jgi:hypothetical protein